jgi:hypothetical protein
MPVHRSGWQQVWRRLTAVPGLRWRDLLVCAIDGTSMTVADSLANLNSFTKHSGNHGGSGMV